MSEWKQKHDMKAKEIEKLRDEMKKKDKGTEDRITQINNSLRQLSEQNQKLKSDQKRQSDISNEYQSTIKDLERKLKE